MTETTTAPLPRILFVESFSDSGEYGNAECPHCGAKGRYVWTFRCEDGTRRGAMAGCIKLFPRGPLYEEHARLVERLKDRQKRGQSLASWDETKLGAIEDVADGKATVEQALLVIRQQNARRSEWMERNGRKRW